MIDDLEGSAGAGQLAVEGKGEGEGCPSLGPHRAEALRGQVDGSGQGVHSFRYPPLATEVSEAWEE